MRVQSLGFRTDLMLRRLEGSEITDHGDYLVVRTPANPTFWWGNFLLLPEAVAGDQADLWTSRFAEAFPGAGHVALGIDTPGAGPGLAGFQQAGFQVERDAVLATDAVREPSHVNQAVLVRPLESPEDWRQSVELRLACHEDGEPGNDREFLERRTAQNRGMVQRGHGAWFGAFADGRLLAQFGVFSDGAEIARYQGVETHPSARRQGLAGTLLHRAGVHAGQVLGARTLVIVADPDYSAIALYRSAGFADRETQLSLQRVPG
jgi:ribosomal protein S18 acetylase RimI-like enzyme